MAEMFMQPMRRLNRQYSLADALAQQSMSTAPIQSPLQGLARLGQAVAGAYVGNRADNRVESMQRKYAADMGEFMRTGQIPADASPEITGQIAPLVITQKMKTEADEKSRKAALADQKSIADYKAKIAGDQKGAFGDTLQGRMWNAYQAGQGDPNYKAAVSFLSKPQVIQTPAGTMMIPAAVNADGTLNYNPATGQPAQGQVSQAAGIIPGTDPASVEKEKSAATLTAKLQEQFPKAREALGSLETQQGVVLEEIKRAKELIGLTTVGFGSVLKGVPSTGAYNLSRLFDTIKANVGFDKLQDMRANSPTGGALGQVSENENKLLQSVLGSLDQGQSQEQLIQTIDRLEKIIRESTARRRAAFETDFGAVMPQGGNAPASSQSTTPANQGQDAGDLRKKYGLE